MRIVFLLRNTEIEIANKKELAKLKILQSGEYNTWFQTEEFNPPSGNQLRKCRRILRLRLGLKTQLHCWHIEED